MANANMDARFNAVKVMSQHFTLNVTVTGLRWLKFRLCCAWPFLWLGSVIAGVEFRFEQKGRD